MGESARIMDVPSATEINKYIGTIKNKFTLEHIEKVLGRLKGIKVFVIGDIIIDEYWFVVPKGRAAKDPILSVDYMDHELYAGGILAIANHISNFVDNVYLFSLLGDRDDKKEFINKALNKNINTHFLVKKDSPTTTKKRYINKIRNEKLFKIEFMNDAPISKELEKDVIGLLEKELPKFDLVVVGDYGHGFINENIIKVLEEKSKYLCVNVQTNSANLGFNYLTKYNSPSFAAMDLPELRYAVCDRFSELPVLINKLHKAKSFNKFLVTLGASGVAYFKQNKIHHGPAFTSRPRDVVGAGDAVFSIASLMEYINAPEELVPFVANCVGGIAVSIMGNKESVTKERLTKFITDLYDGVK